MFQVTDAGMKLLAGHSLEELRLGETAIGDVGLRHVAAHKQLTLLMLNHTRVTDAGMKDVANLNKLSLLDQRA